MSQPSTELSVQSLGDAVKDKVRKALFDSIPDEGLQKLIASEFNRFFEDKREYGRSEDSPFKVMVRNEITAQFRERISKLVAEAGQLQWDNNGGQKMIGPMVEELAPHVLQGLIRSLTANTVMALQSQGQRF